MVLGDAGLKIKEWVILSLRSSRVQIPPPPHIKIKKSYWDPFDFITAYTSGMARQKPQCMQSSASHSSQCSFPCCTTTSTIRFSFLSRSKIRSSSIPIFFSIGADSAIILSCIMRSSSMYETYLDKLYAPISVFIPSVSLYVLNRS